MEQAAGRRAAAAAALRPQHRFHKVFEPKTSSETNSRLRPHFRRRRQEPRRAPREQVRVRFWLRWLLTLTREQVRVRFWLGWLLTLTREQRVRQSAALGPPSPSTSVFL